MNRKVMIIGAFIGVLIYILISMYLPFDYITKLSLGLLLLILYLGLVFQKKVNRIRDFDKFVKIYK